MHLQGERVGHLIQQPPYWPRRRGCRVAGPSRPPGSLPACPLLLRLFQELLPPSLRALLIPAACRRPRLQHCHDRQERPRFLRPGNALAGQPLAQRGVADRGRGPLLLPQGDQAGQRRRPRRRIQAAELIPQPPRSPATVHPPPSPQARSLPDRKPAGKPGTPTWPAYRSAAHATRSRRKLPGAPTPETSARHPPGPLRSDRRCS